MSDHQEAGKDTEIVLGTGKLLGIFFGLVAICGTFFGLGYSVGRSSSPMALQSGPTTLASSSGAKPGAGVTVTAAPAPVTEATPPATDQTSAASTPAEQSPPQPSATPTESSSATTNPDVKTVAAVQNPAVPESATQGSITVQVAAVTKQEDADALVAALRRKNYPVFVPPSPSSDNLYHVQVGPFAELKDAETMKSKLAGDGYNAIVKK